jgi:hypothetical protein
MSHILTIDILNIKEPLLHGITLDAKKIFAICSRYMFIDYQKFTDDDILHTFISNVKYDIMEHTDIAKISNKLHSQTYSNVKNKKQLVKSLLSDAKFRIYNPTLIVTIIDTLSVKRHVHENLIITNSTNEFADISDLFSISVMFYKNIYSSEKYNNDNNITLYEYLEKNTQSKLGKYSNIIIANDSFVSMAIFPHLEQYIVLPSILMSLPCALKLLCDNGTLIINLPSWNTDNNIALNKILSILCKCFTSIELLHNNEINRVNMYCVFKCVGYHYTLSDIEFKKIHEIAMECVNINVSVNEMLAIADIPHVNIEKYITSISARTNNSSVKLITDIGIPLMDIDNEQYKKLIRLVNIHYTRNINLIIYLNKLFTNETIQSYIHTGYLNDLQYIVKVLDDNGIMVNNYYNSQQSAYYVKLVMSLYNFSGTYTKILQEPNIKWKNIPTDAFFNDDKLRVDISKNYYKLVSLRRAFSILEKSNDSAYFEKVTYVTYGIGRGLAKCVNKYMYNKLSFKPSNAFSKLYEILHTYNLLPMNEPINTFHLAEAPGQFIISTKYYIHTKISKTTKHNWYANSLNPHNEQIKKKFGNNIFGDNYGLMKHHIDKWLFGNGTGDITDPYNIKLISDKLINYHPHLITGDAGIDTDLDTYDLQKLEYAQCMLALSVAKNGSNVVIKHFLPHLPTKRDTIDAGMFFVNLIYIYWLSFDSIYLSKPTTSNSCSGEFYIVCKNFKGIDKERLDIMVNKLNDFKINTYPLGSTYINSDFMQFVNSFMDDIIRLIIRTSSVSYILTRCYIDNDKNINRILLCDNVLDSKTHNKLVNKMCEIWINNFGFIIDNTFKIN